MNEYEGDDRRHEAEHVHTDMVVRKWEGHAQTFIGAIGVALIFWIGTSVVDLNSKFTGMSVKLEQLSDIKIQLTTLDSKLSMDKRELMNELRKNNEGDSAIRERVALLEHQIYEGIK
ncbi:MAG: hypothetical protein GQ474_07845 [Sulfurimonas sp.]|nr:hypothetical protein [Sulfurimonas sp.]